MGSIENFFHKFRQPLQMFWIYMGATTLDFVSSLKIRGGVDQETNPFARHADGSFWPLHACINDTINTLEILIISLIVYKACKILGWRLRRFAAGLPWLYFAYGHIDAAFFNFMAMWWPGLFVETHRDLLQHILGGL